MSCTIDEKTYSQRRACALVGIEPNDCVLRHGALVIGQERTPEQDLEFSIRRIVEIAQRALSLATNDPTTALYCIDRLGETLRRIANALFPRRCA